MDYYQPSVGGNGPRGQWLIKVATVSRMCCALHHLCISNQKCYQMDTSFKTTRSPFLPLKSFFRWQDESWPEKIMVIKKLALFTPRNVCSHSFFRQVFTCARWMQHVFIKFPLSSSPRTHLAMDQLLQQSCRTISRLICEVANVWLC